MPILFLYSFHFGNIGTKFLTAMLHSVANSAAIFTEFGLILPGSKTKAILPLFERDILSGPLPRLGPLI